MSTPDLYDALANIITKATSGVGAGISFLSEQIPDVIHQLLLWKLTASLAIGLLLLILVVVYLYFTIKGFKKGWWRDVDLGPIWFLIVTPISFGAAGGVIYYLLIALKIWLAPKVWPIEYAAHLVKGN